MKREYDGASFPPCFLLWRFFCCIRTTRMNNASVFSLHCLSIGALKICFFQYPTLTQQLLFKAVAQCVWGLCVYGSFSSFHVERNPFVPNNSRVKKLWQYIVGLLCLLCCCFTGSVALYKQYSITDLKHKRQSEQVAMGSVVFFLTISGSGILPVSSGIVKAASSVCHSIHIH